MLILRYIQLQIMHYINNMIKSEPFDMYYLRVKVSVT